MGSFTVALASAEDFKRFALKYAVKGEGCIFVKNVELDGKRYHDKVNTPASQYTVYAVIADRDAVVTYLAAPTLPREWHYADNERIAREFNSKTELVKYLRNELKADTDKMASFAKVTVSQLQQIVDSSDDDQDETTVRVKHDKDDKFTLPVNALGLKEVLVTVKKPRGNASLEYLLSADYSSAWAKLHEENKMLLSDLSSSFMVLKER